MLFQGINEVFLSVDSDIVDLQGSDLLTGLLHMHTDSSVPTSNNSIHPCCNHLYVTNPTKSHPKPSVRRLPQQDIINLCMVRTFRQLE